MGSSGSPDITQPIAAPRKGGQLARQVSTVKREQGPRRSQGRQGTVLTDDQSVQNNRNIRYKTVLGE